MSIGIYVVCVTCPTHLGLGDCVGLEPTAYTSDLVVTKKPMKEWSVVLSPFIVWSPLHHQVNTANVG